MDSISEGPTPDLGDLFAHFFVSHMGQVFSQMVELAKRLIDDEGDEFASGLRELLHTAIDRNIRPDATEIDFAEAMSNLVAYLESWILSARVDGSEHWHRQMAETATAIREGTLGEPVTRGILSTLVR